MAAPKHPLLGGFTEKEYLNRVAEWLVACFESMGEDMARERVEEAMVLAIPGRGQSVDAREQASV